MGVVVARLLRVMRALHQNLGVRPLCGPRTSLPHPQGEHDQRDADRERVEPDEPHMREQPHARQDRHHHSEDDGENPTRNRTPSPSISHRSAMAATTFRDAGEARPEGYDVQPHE